MKLFLIRHTSVAVDSGICYGQSDVGLAETFKEEKNQVAALIQNISFDKIYSSSLSRCKLLAVELFQHNKIVFDPRLKELNFGDWELQSWNAIYSNTKGKIWMDNYQTLPTLNGESYPEMEKRIVMFLEDLKKKELKNVAIVAHAGVIRIFKSLIECKSIDELFRTFKPAYGSVTKFQI